MLEERSAEIGGGTRGRSLGAVDDAGLVGLARRGSQLAWDEIVQRFGGLIATIARYHRLSEADAADVAQATWVQLFRHLGDLRRPERLAYWLATTARHECLRVVGLPREQPVDPADVDAWPVYSPDPLDEVLVDEQRRAVRGAADRMSSRSRLLLDLLVWEERPYHDVAATLGMPIGSIGPTRQRTLRRLARHPDIARLVLDGQPAA